MAAFAPKQVAVDRVPPRARTTSPVPESAAPRPAHVAAAASEFDFSQTPGRTIQRKPSLGAADDVFEREADATAERIMRMADPAAITPAAPVVQRKCAQCKEDDAKIRAKRSGESVATAPDTAQAAHAASQGGTPLPSAARAFFEPRFGRDFSQVRVHADTQAADAARSVQARAYTLGSHIVFGTGEYAPASSAGRRLLAHELTHVVQQGASPGVVRRQLVPEVPPEVPFEPMPFPQMPELELEPVPEMPPELPQAPELAPAPDVAPLPDVAPTPQTTPAPPLTDPLPPVAPTPDVQPAPPEQGADDDEADSDCGTADMPFTEVTGTPGPRGQGGLVEASPLTRCPGNTRGSLPSSSIFEAQFNCIAKAGETDNWIRAHVLHGKTKRNPLFNLHGPGNMKWNLIIADKSLNGSMRAQAEGPVIDRVHRRNEVMWYRAKVDAYVPGLDYFAESITVDFGRYDTKTKTQGPREGGGTFKRVRTPPNCPPGAPTGAVLPGIPPVGTRAARQATAAPLFRSTLEVCLKQLRSRTFAVAGGGLQLRIAAGWFSRGGNPRDAQTCPLKDYTVTLWKNNGRFWPDGEFGHVTVPVDRSAKVKWRFLPDGDYYFVIESGNSDSRCCLRGEMAVGTFSAPRLPRGATMA